MHTGICIYCIDLNQVFLLRQIEDEDVAHIMIVTQTPPNIRKSGDKARPARAVKSDLPAAQWAEMINQGLQRYEQGLHGPTTQVGRVTNQHI